MLFFLFIDYNSIMSCVEGIIQKQFTIHYHLLDIVHDILVISSLSVAHSSALL